MVTVIDQKRRIEREAIMNAKHFVQDRTWNGARHEDPYSWAVQDLVISETAALVVWLVQHIESHRANSLVKIPHGYIAYLVSNFHFHHQFVLIISPP